MAKRGRKSKYDECIKPYLDDIRRHKSNGATDKQICEAYGISQDTFYQYMKKYPEFAEINKKGRKKFCLDLRGELAKLAFKHKLETKKQYITQDEGGKKTQHTEIITKEVDGDIAAINLLLKNLDSENWSNDPQNLSLRQQELELRKAIAKSQNFDLEIE